LDFKRELSHAQSASVFFVADVVDILAPIGIHPYQHFSNERLSTGVGF
jgi:hypothetical protein